MRYLGSKRRIAKQIAAVIEPTRGKRVLLEPFCGGLGATFAFGAGVIASDSNTSLLALYTRVQREGTGWLPDRATREERDASLSLPNDDPLKAFYRIGCGFGGDWNGGFAKNDAKNDYVQQTKNSLSKIKGSPVYFVECDFFDLPVSGDTVLYCDPPYRGTTGYAQPFDHAAFDARVVEWASAGADVYVSEYDLPIGELVWSTQLRQMNGKQQVSVEKLFRVRGAL